MIHASDDVDEPLRGVGHLNGGASSEPAPAAGATDKTDAPSLGYAIADRERALSDGRAFHDARTTRWPASRSQRAKRADLAKAGGEGGIRTHVPVTRQDAFEAPPLRPLRYLSVLSARGRRCAAVPSGRSLQLTALRSLFAARSAPFALGAHVSLRRGGALRPPQAHSNSAARRAAKNSCSIARHSASSTPPAAAMRWLSDGCS